MKELILAVSLFVAVSCATAPKVQSEGARLNTIVAQYTEAAKHIDPYYAPYFNLESELDKFGDYLATDYFARDKANLRQTLSALDSLDQTKLTADELLLYRLLHGQLEIGLEGYNFPQEDLSFNQMGSRIKEHIDSSDPKLTDFPFDSAKHYNAYITRTKGFGPYIDRQIAVMRKGIAEQVTLNCETVEKAPNSYKEALEPDAEKNPFYRPVTKFPETIEESDRVRLRAAFATMIRQEIVPNLERFDRFLRKEYAPHCRKTFGIGDLPNGKAWYAYAIKASTDMARDPNELHELGLSEVKRIDHEREEVRRQLGFKGTRAQFIKSTAKDPKYFFNSAEDMFQAFLAVKAKVQGKIPAYFSLVPKTDFEIVEVSNPEQASGSYSGPTESRPSGRFMVNTKNLHIVPKAEVTTLLMHEGIPGHHFQVALQFEQKDRLSEYQRKIFTSTSFAEGWALYAEYLGREMGMFEDPLQRLGNLNQEMMRAVRLVVDTGMHAKGWSKAKVVKFMSDHLSSSERQIDLEANRYSVDPGQALAYKVGQLKIIELRRQAERELGPKFDIREFHRVVIGDGTLSLPVLEQKVKAWIKSSHQQ